MHYKDPEIQDRIAHLFSNMAVPTRIATAETIAHDYASEVLEGDDFHLTDLLIRYLINDVEQQVRLAVAETVKSYANLPHEIALHLALDDELVSDPIIRYSIVLNEEDLINVFACASQAKQVIIAQREGISSRLTEFIAQKGCQDAVQACLENRTAVIEEIGFNQILIRYAHEERIHELIVQRPELPESTVTKLCYLITEDLKDQLFEKTEIPKEISARLIENAREKTLLEQMKARAPLVEKQKRSKTLHLDGSLTATLMLRMLLKDDLVFFSTAMAEVSGISYRRVNALIADRGPLGLKRLYEKSGLPHYLYPAFKTALQELVKIKAFNPRATNQNKQQRLVQKIAKIYNLEENISMESLMERLLPVQEHKEK